MVVDWPYTYEILPIAGMVVDEEYQRPLSSFYKTIRDRFDPALFGTLIVARRKWVVGRKFHNRVAVVDGQSRRQALMEMEVADAPCLVYDGLTLPEESSLFARFQTERRGIRPTIRFRAEVLAGHARALEIDEVLKETGFKVVEPSEGAMTTQAVVALERVCDEGGADRLWSVLNVIGRSWPDRFAASGEMIRALGYFLARNTDIDQDELVEKLRGTTPVEISRRASALREGRGVGGGSPSYTAEVIDTIYRAKARRKKNGS